MTKLELIQAVMERFGYTRLDGAQRARVIREYVKMTKSDLELLLTKA